MSKAVEVNAPSPFFDNAQIMVLSTDEVIVPERLGFLHWDKAAALGKMMKRDGQRDAVKVRARKPSKTKPQTWELIVGLHRLSGAELEGLPIKALEVVGDDDTMREIEASENIHRRDPPPLERATFVAELVNAAKRRLAEEHGDISHQELGAKVRWERAKEGLERKDEVLEEEAGDACATMAQAYGWEESVTEAFNLSRRAIHRDLSLWRLLIEPFPELTEQLSAHPIVGSNRTELVQIGKIDREDLRRTAIEALIADPEMDADGAYQAAGVPTKKVKPSATPVAHQKHIKAILGGWQRLSRPQRSNFLPTFVNGLTDGEKTALRSLLDEENGQ